MVLIEEKQKKDHKNGKKIVQKDQKKTFSKKEYLLKILDSLMSKRPLAKGLKALLEGGNLDNKTIDSLVEIFRKVIKNVTNKISKDKFVKGLSIVEKMKQNEIKVTQQEENNLDQLLSGI